MEKRIERAEEEPNQEQAEDDQPREKDDPILDLAIEYVVNSAYPTGISKEKLRMTTAYHPQANGLDERLNQTLINALLKFAQVNRDMWDENDHVTG